MEMWAILRDEELFEAYRTKRRATEVVKLYRPGSKHHWRVMKITIKGYCETK